MHCLRVLPIPSCAHRCERSLVRWKGSAVQAAAGALPQEPGAVVAESLPQPRLRPLVQPASSAACNTPHGLSHVAEKGGGPAQPSRGGLAWDNAFRNPAWWWRKACPTTPSSQEHRPFSIPLHGVHGPFRRCLRQPGRRGACLLCSLVLRVVPLLGRAVVFQPNLGVAKP